MNAENNWWEVHLEGQRIGFIANSVIHRTRSATAPRQRPSRPSQRTSGATHVTVQGYVACVSRTDFDAQFDFLNDRVAWSRFIANSSCVITRAGIPIFTKNARGLGVIQIRVEGETAWIFTVTEAARRR